MVILLNFNLLDAEGDDADFVDMGESFSGFVLETFCEAAGVTAVAIAFGTIAELIFPFTQGILDI